MTAAEALGRGTLILQEAGVPDARHDAGQLLAFVLGVSRLVVLANGVSILDSQAEADFLSLVMRRAAREPLQYILRSQEFMGITFKVTPAALIPRCDTEALCIQALLHMHGDEQVLDLCTGSGALAIAIKKRMQRARITATDLSHDAIALARENAALADTVIEFAEGDLFAPLAGRTFDVIVCNPPYIPDMDRETLQAELLFEPPMALFAGADGLDVYRRVIGEAPGHLLPGGRLLLELGDGQADAVTTLMAGMFTGITVHPDVQGLIRVAAGVRKG
jgi:release factor glutamine methyltransferase